MHYDEDYITPNQKKEALKIIKSIIKALKIKEKPEYVIKGLNPTELIEIKRKDIKNKSNKEIKETEKLLKAVMKNKDQFVKVSMEFDDKPFKKLVVRTDIVLTTKLNVISYLWNAYLDFPIESSVIFGRVHRKQVHGDGIYLFAPIELDMPDTLNLVDTQIQDNNKDEFFKNYIENDGIITSLKNIRFGNKAYENMKNMLDLIKIKSNTGIKIVDELNKNKYLLKIMKMITHFGTTYVGNYKLVSDVDVSTICVPLNVATLVQIFNMADDHITSIKVLSELCEVLNNYRL